LILSYSDLSTDPRVIRQINALNNHYSITASGLNPSDIEDVKNIPIKLKVNKEINFHLDYPLPVRKAFSFFIKNYLRTEKKITRFQKKSLERSANFEKRYWTIDKINFVERLGKEKFDLIIANDIDTLPLALRISGGKSKVILDSHEYHPRQCENDSEWVKYTQKYTEYLCREYMSKADLVFAVSEGIADEFRKNYNVDPLLLTNATEHNNLSPGKVNEEHIKIIHHGSAKESRNLEIILEMMKFTDSRFTLDLMLIPTHRDYYNELLIKYSSEEKIKFTEPVRTKDIPGFINRYDIGIFLLPPVNFNYEYALPNKFFEFIQGRLCIAIGPSAEMEKYVKKYELGIISEDFTPEKMAEKLNSLTAKEIFRYKENSDKYSKELSAEKNLELIRSKAEELLCSQEIITEDQR